MTLHETLEYWRRERERLAGIESWVEAGNAAVPRHDGEGGALR
jgi:hypothetical protein